MKKLETLGARVQQARNAAMLSRPQLSAVTGVPTSSIEKIEYGTQDPSITRIEQLALALNVSADYLIKGDVEDKENNSKDMPHSNANDKLNTVIENTIGNDLTEVISKLSYLDELRETGFQKSWRTSPRLFEEVNVDLQSLNDDEILDLSEQRGLYPVEQGFNKEDVLQRIIDTAHFGRDLHFINVDDLTRLATSLSIETDADCELCFWKGDWESEHALINAIREYCRSLSLKGKAPLFTDIEEFREREVA